MLYRGKKKRKYRRDKNGNKGSIDFRFPDFDFMNETKTELEKSDAS